LGEVVALEETALGGRVCRRRDHGRAFAAVSIAGKFVLAAPDVAALQIQFRAVAEGILDGIGVEVLVNAIAAVMAAAGSLRLNGPSIFHPTALVNVVNQV